MTVLSPIWLIGLAPWLALALWMLRGRGTLQRVPYLELWNAPAHVAKASSKRQLPPIAVIGVLIALLLGVFSAARVAIGKRQQVTLTLIVDRGSRMSATTQIPRYLSRTYEVLDELERRWPRARISLISVPGAVQSDLSIEDCRRAVRKFYPTPIDTTQLLAQVTSANRSNAVVVSNQAGDVLNDIGIVNLALATAPHPQLMVRLQNFSQQTSINLLVETAGMKTTRTVPLPAAGSTGNVFIDLDRVGDEIRVSFDRIDENPLNNYAYLIRETDRREPDPRTQLSPAQQRVIAVYQRNRVASPNAAKLPIIDHVEGLGSDAGIVVPKVTGSRLSDSPTVVKHSITENVDWRSLPKEMEIADAPEGWTPIVSFGSHACVAINPERPRQVWVGLDSPSWTSSKDFVIFWTNLLDYASGGSEAWAAHSLTEWTPEWKFPSLEDGVEVGVYQRSDGVKRAFNASEVPAKPVIVEDWRSQLDRIKPESTAGEVGPALLIAALGLIAFFAVRV